MLKLMLLVALIGLDFPMIDLASIQKDFNETHLISACVNPSEDELNAQLTKVYIENYDEVLSDWEQFQLVRWQKNKTMPIIVRGMRRGFPNKKLIVNIEGNTLCSRTEQTKWQQGTTTCPYHYVKLKRSRRYPFIRSHAVCNCDKCLLPESINHESLRCVPHNILMPVLIRRQCHQPSGVYNWVPAFEIVSVFCNCVEVSILA